MVIEPNRLFITLIVIIVAFNLDNLITRIHRKKSQEKRCEKKITAISKLPQA